MSLVLLRGSVLVLTDQAHTTGGRLAWRIRWIAVRGLASAIAGVVVLGIGGRLVMLASRLLHPDSVGRFTENGNRIGQVTVDGTIGLVLFGGVFGGLTAGVIWVFLKEWIPENPVAVGLGAVAIGGFLLVEADNPDFVILQDPQLDLVLLLSLIFVFGLVLYWLDGVLDRGLPSAGGIVSTVVYTLLAAIGVPFLIPTFGSLFYSELCFCQHPPVWTGVFLVIAAFATAAWWVLALKGSESPPRPLQRSGEVATLGAIIAGGIHLTGQVMTIL